jgi:very-short-patch-repair endonuclease
VGHLEHIGDIQLDLAGCGQRTLREQFLFLAWAASEGFTYPPRAKPLLLQTGSAAEAFLLRELFEYDDTYCDHDGCAHVDDVTIAVQVPCGSYRIDATAEQDGWRLAIEVDGLAFHRATQEQVAADYYRERRILRAGYIVTRFTAKEAMVRPQECWRDVFDILRAYGTSRHRVSA